MSCNRASLKDPNHKLKIMGANMPLNKIVLPKGAEKPGGPQTKYWAPLPFPGQFKCPGLLQNEVISRGLRGQFLFCWQILLYRKPLYYAKMFYNQKSRYLINMQIINIPGCKTIHYASRFQGNQHDTHCFKFTQLGKRPFKFLDQGGCYWENQGYLWYK